VPISVLSLLAQDHTSLHYVLEIDGVPVLFYSGPATPGANACTWSASRGSPAAATLPAEYRPGLLSVTGGESTLDQVSGSATHGPMQVRIADTGIVAAGGNGAASVLTRLTARGATRQTRLAGTIDKAAPGAALAQVLASSSLAGWDTPGVLWIGEEAILYTSTGSGPDRFITATRGYYGSRTQAHTLDARLGDAPIITSECVHWRTRRARVRLGVTLPDGSAHPDYIDVVAGYVDRSPQVGNDGVITLTIVPHSAALGTPVVAASRTTQLVHGYHAFDGVNAGAVEAFTAWPAGAAYSERLEAAHGAGTIQVSVPARGHSSFFDIAAPGGTATNPAVVLGDSNGPPYVVLAYPAGVTLAEPELQFSAGLAAVAQANTRVQNARTVLVYRAEIVTPGGGLQVVRWPEAMLEAVNKDNGFSRVSHLLSGAGEPGWVELVLEPSVPMWTARLTSSIAPPGALRVAFNVSEDASGQIDPASCWTPFMYDRAHHSDVNVGFFDVDASRDSADIGRNELRFEGLALAWYQAGETYLLVEDDIFGGASVARPKPIEIEFSRALRGSPRAERVRSFAYIDNTGTAVTDGADTIGYRVNVAGQFVPSFADFDVEGWERAVIRRVIAWQGVDLPTAVLEVLQSDTGDGTNGTHDVRPGGANLTDDDVDEVSVTLIQAPPAVAQFSGRIRSGDSPIDLFGGALRFAGVALGMRLDRETGRQKVAVVQYRRANPILSVAALTEADFAVMGPGESITDERTANRLRLRVYPPEQLGQFGYVPEDPEPLEVLVDVVSGQNEHGREVSEVAEDLYGTSIDGNGPEEARRILQAPALARLRRTLHPRRVWAGTVPTSRAVGLTVGDTVTVTHTRLRGYDGSAGVVAAPALVQKVGGPNWQTGRTAVELVYHGAKTTGFAPSLKVASVLSPTEVRVEANAYTLAARPETGAAQSDVDYWAVNDTALCVPVGSFSTAVARTVTAITNNDVTFDLAHGLSAGDTIRPRDYDSASSAHQAYAYLADSTEEVGAAGLAAYEYD